MSKCYEPGGCSAADSAQVKCVVAALKLNGNWLKSGLPFVSDSAIVERVMRMNERHVKLSSQKHLQTPMEISRRSSFKEDMLKLFDISPKNCIDILRADKLRSEEAVEEDVTFYLDQLSARVGQVSTERDLDFDDSVAEKQMMIVMRTMTVMMI